jgi:hypothetical protein
VKQAIVHARIAQLYRELAVEHDRLAGGETRQPRRAVVLEPRKPKTEPTELQRAKAERILRQQGVIR